jgi:hypothetical protein
MPAKYVGTMLPTKNLLFSFLNLLAQCLEQMLADRRLLREQSLLHCSATNTIRTADDNLSAVGPTLLLDVSIEGLPSKPSILVPN